MTTGTTTGTTQSATGPGTSSVSGRAVTGLALRQLRRSGLIVLGLTALMPAVVAATYDTVMADPAAAGSIAKLAANPAIRTLFGEPVGLDQAGGFTVWRVGTFIAVLLGVWSILATTRITRGEEEARRWDMLLAGPVPLRSVVTRHLATVMIIPAAAGVAVTAVLVVSGTDLAGAVVHGVGIGSLGLFFVALAGLATQTFSTRASATTASVALLAAGLLVRMVGDGVTDLAWLRWLSPFGLLALSGPYVQNRALPLVILLVVAAAAAVAAISVAGTRDLGAGLVAAVGDRRPRFALLGSVEAFAVRRMRWPLAGWAIGISAYFLLIGLTTLSVTELLADNPALAEEAARAGFARLGAVEGFTATLFALLALPVGGFVAVRAGAYVAVETCGQLTLISAQPVSRIRLLGAELVITIAGAMALLTLAGLATWAGITATGGDVTLFAALRGTWNTLPIVLISLGAATLAIGWAPRAATIAGTLPATGGFVLLVIAESIDAPDWVRQISPFAHLATVPLTGSDWPATLIMTGLAITLAAAGAVGYQRRDLQG